MFHRITQFLFPVALQHLEFEWQCQPAKGRLDTSTAEVCSSYDAAQDRKAARLRMGWYLHLWWRRALELLDVGKFNPGFSFKWQANVF